MAQVNDSKSVVGCKIDFYVDNAALLVADPKAEEIQVKLNSKQDVNSNVII